MDMQAIKDEILLNLTGDVVEMELTDASLTRIVNSALREIQRYIDTFAIITIPFQKCIDLSTYNVSSVIGVRRAEGFVADDTASDQGMILDPMAVTQWQLLTGTGNVNNISDYAHNLAAWNAILQIRNTTSTDLSHYFDKTSNKLYINISSNLPQNITVLYIPRFDDVSQITSDYWIDMLIRVAVAQTKIAVGRVRSKFKQSNALWVLDGDALLQEGNTELNELRTHLTTNTQLVFGID